MLVVALVASGCTSGSPSGAKASHAPPPSPTPVGPQTFTVSVDGSSKALPMVADAFFPPLLSVHPGDTINFTEVWTGELHTVTMGTLVEKAVANPNSSAAAALPALIPSGRSDTIQSAAQPCFIQTGTPPVNNPCPAVSQPAFDGTQAYFNSGWLSQGTNFSVLIATGTVPGQYHYKDLAHPGVTGEFDVSPLSQTIATPANVASTAATQLNDVVKALTPAAQDAEALTTTATSGINYVAGVTEPSLTNAFVATFGPPDITATAGQTISWTLYGQHALGLNPPTDGTGTGLLTRASDGTTHINQVVFNRAGGTFTPYGPQTSPITVSGGTYFGTTFHNSGLLTSTTGGLVTYTLVFANPGTYTLHCLVHPAMTQNINVR